MPTYDNITELDYHQQVYGEDTYWARTYGEVQVIVAAFANQWGYVLFDQASGKARAGERHWRWNAEQAIEAAKEAVKRHNESHKHGRGT